MLPPLMTAETRAVIGFEAFEAVLSSTAEIICVMMWVIDFADRTDRTDG